MIPQATVYRHAVLLATWLIVLAACGTDNPSGPTSTPDVNTTAQGVPYSQAQSDPAAHYLGSDSCAECHQDQFTQWQGSHHQLAMQTADASSVLGDFNNSSATSHGQSFEFFTREEKFFVRTLNAQAEAQEFEVSDTFGVAPLQQYLTTLPNGARQALPMAWNTTPEALGGQQWFHLYPDEPIPPGDRLHWTGPLQNWNHQCADCHSTNMRKNASLDEETGKLSFQPEFSDINVGCEACHGPGSKHTSWANEKSSERSNSPELSNKGFAANIDDADTQLYACARCHSRRQTIAEGFSPGDSFYDYYLPALLTPGLYHHDGQIDDEVFVFGSFMQSKMHQAGVRCNDCHNSHSNELNASGNEVCTQCHSVTGSNRFEGLRSKLYDSPDHHFHPQDSTGGQCKNCHMPVKTYMVNDPRHDHSFRIPRPDLSEQTGVPNTCTSCHQEKNNNWAAETIRQWYKSAQHSNPARIDSPHFAQAFSSANDLIAGAAPQLANIASNPSLPAIVRASALQAAAPIMNQATLDAARQAAESNDVLSQLGALRALENVPIAHAWPVAVDLLSNKYKAVRIEAARVLAAAPDTLLSAKEKRALQTAVNEYKTSQRLNLDRPEAWGNLGTLALMQNDPDEARAAFNRALRVDAAWLPAYLNLADLERQLGDEAAAEIQLREALKLAPQNVEANHALGLWLSRAGRLDEALISLQNASELSVNSPSHWHYRYVYAIALNSTGNSSAAIEELETALDLSAENTQILYALATVHRDMGNQHKARAYAQRMVALAPQDPQAVALARSLQSN